MSVFLNFHGSHTSLTVMKIVLPRVDVNEVEMMGPIDEFEYASHLKINLCSTSKDQGKHSP